MSRFFRAPDARYVDFIVEPNWELAEKALTLKQKQYDSALAALDMLEGQFDFQHINEEVENQKAKVLKDYYDSGVENLANEIRRTGDYRKVLPKIKKLKMEFLKDYKEGRIAKMQKSLQNYLAYQKAIETAKKNKKDYTLQQAIMNKKWEEWLKNPNRSLDNPLEYVEALEKPEELRPDNIINLAKKAAADKGAVLKILQDGTYRIMYQDGTVEELSKDKLINLAMDYIGSSDTAMPYLKQVQDYMGQKIFDENGRLISPVTPVFINVENGKQIGYDEFKNLDKKEKMKYIKDYQFANNMLGNLVKLSSDFAYRKEDLKTHFKDKKEALEYYKYQLRKKEKEEEMARQMQMLASPMDFATFTKAEIDANIDNYLNLVSKKKVKDMTAEEYAQYSKLESLFGPVVEQSWNDMKKMLLSEDSPFSLGFKAQITNAKSWQDLDTNTRQKVIAIMLEARHPLKTTLKGTFGSTEAGDNIHSVYDVNSTGLSGIRKRYKWFKRFNKRMELDKKLDNLKNSPTIIKPALVLNPENEVSKGIINKLDIIMRNQQPSTFVRGNKVFESDGNLAPSDKVAWDTSMWSRGNVVKAPMKELLDKVGMNLQQAIESGLVDVKTSMEGSRLIVRYNFNNEKMRQLGIDVGDRYYPKNGLTEVYDNVNTDAIIGDVVKNVDQSNPDARKFLKMSTDWVYASINTIVDKAASEIESEMYTGLKVDKNPVSRTYEFPNAPGKKFRIKASFDKNGNFEGYKLEITDGERNSNGTYNWQEYTKDGVSLFRSIDDIKTVLLKPYGRQL